MDTKAEISSHAVDYFSNLLGSDNLSLSSEDKATIKSFTHFRCNNATKEALSAPISPSVIKRVVFSMACNKSPGPDGFTSDFFRRTWDITGALLTEAVSEFFVSGKLLKQWNATSLSLIPKKESAVKLEDFRPISCCNVVYKIISKILAIRLQDILPMMISSNQSAFVKDRLMVENVLLATELMHGFGNHNQSSRGLLKVDLRKAFDSISWDFLQCIMEAAEFPQVYIRWIMECISSPSFSVKINGELCGFFKGRKGLRQGDPISPYLFLMAMETFSNILDARYCAGEIGYHPLAKNPKITHLAFADDLMIFFDGKEISLRGISAALESFRALSGLSVNPSKISLYYAGITNSESKLITNHGFASGTLPVTYLGLPLLNRKLKKAEYSPLLDRIAARFNAWSVRHLSFAGRLKLLESVIYGILNFWQSAFRVPKGCLIQIQKMCNGFLWSGDIRKKDAVRISWDKCCLPKDEGGLGLRNFVLWNKTLNMKLLWILFRNSGSLWVAWCRAHYIKGKSFWSLNRAQHGSWSWNSLLQLRTISKPLISCSIGNGRTASFWFDNWTSCGPLLDTTGPSGPRRIGIPLHATVSQATEEGIWSINSRLSRDVVIRELQDLLSTINVPTPGAKDDRYEWGPIGKRGDRFSNKLAWETVRPRQELVSWRKVVWFKHAIPKQAFNFWTANYDRLPTRSRLVSWGISTTSDCCLCNCAEETRNHLFLQCPFAEHLWTHNLRRLDTNARIPRDWQEMIDWIISASSNNRFALRVLVAQATIYFVWRERNTRIHGGTVSTPQMTLKQIDRNIRDSLIAKRFSKGCSNLLSTWLRFS